MLRIIGAALLFLFAMAGTAQANFVTKNITSADGTAIYADATGSAAKPSLVFVHGLSLSGAVFDDLFNDHRLQANYYLVRFDMRGHGRSGKPGTIEGYSSQDYANDFHAVVKAFNLHKPILVGWSLGASMGPDIATYLNPLPLSGLIFVAPLPWIELAGTVGKPLVLSFLPGLFSTDNVTLSKSTAVDFVESLWYSPASVPFSLKSAWGGMAVMQPPEVTTFVLSRAQNATSLQEAGKKGLPLLLVGGDSDNQVDQEANIRVLQPHFTDFTVKTIKHGSHAVFYDNREEFIQTIMSFAARVTRGL